MTERKKTLFSPVVTSLAGACLTMENWQQVGVTQVAFSLEALIAKPGIAVLESFRDLKHYSGWQGRIILDACIKLRASNGDVVIHSPYDGSKIQLSTLAIDALIQHLNPHEVIGLADESNPSSVWVTDKPAADAIQGKLYCESGIIDILEQQYQQQFSPIDQHCACSTCLDGYTRAYLHHLLQQTPLLAQRLLVMHNVGFMNANS
jgi:queuine tRNA-ribosyltransferase